MADNRHHGTKRIPTDAELKALISANTANKNIVLRTNTVRGSNLSTKLTPKEYYAQLDNIKAKRYALPLVELVDTSLANVGKVTLKLNTDHALLVPTEYEIEYSISKQQYINLPVTGRLPPNQLTCFFSYPTTGNFYIYFRIVADGVRGSWSQPHNVPNAVLQNPDVHKVGVNISSQHNANLTPAITFKNIKGISPVNIDVHLYDGSTLLWSNGGITNTNPTVYVPYGVLQSGKKYDVYYRVTSNDGIEVYGGYHKTTISTKKQNTIVNSGSVYSGIGEIASCIAIGDNKLFIAARPRTIVDNSGVYERWYIGEVHNDNTITVTSIPQDLDFIFTHGEYVSSVVRGHDGNIYVILLPSGILYKIDPLTAKLQRVIVVDTLANYYRVDLVALPDGGIMAIGEDHSDASNKREKWFIWDRGSYFWDAYNDIPLEYTHPKWLTTSDGLLYRIAGTGVINNAGNRTVSVSDIDSKSYNATPYVLPYLSIGVSGCVAPDDRIILGEYYKREFNYIFEEWVLYINAYHFKTRKMQQLACININEHNGINQFTGGVSGNAICVLDDGRVISLVDTANTHGGSRSLTFTVVDA